MFLFSLDPFQLFDFQFDWVIWPPTQFINFALVPSQYRVLYVNSVTVLWDIFLSYMKHYDELETIQEEQMRKI